MNNLPKTRSEALESGSLHYFTGLHCKRGHVAARNVWGKCLECDAETKRQKRASDPEGVRAAQREMYSKKSERCRQVARESYHRNIEKKKAYKKTPEQREKSRARAAEWRKNNPEWLINYRKENRDRERQRGRIYHQNNKEKSAIRSSIRRAEALRRTITLPDLIHELNRLAISEAYQLRKERETQTGIRWHVDHIVPMKATEASGLHVYWNLQLVPAHYNQRKYKKIADHLGWLHDDLLQR